jgi:hypothetical protein
MVLLLKAVYRMERWSGYYIATLTTPTARSTLPGIGVPVCPHAVIRVDGVF